MPAVGSGGDWRGVDWMGGELSEWKGIGGGEGCLWVCC